MDTFENQLNKIASDIADGFQELLAHAERLEDRDAARRIKDLQTHLGFHNGGYYGHATLDDIMTSLQEAHDAHEEDEEYDDED